MNIDELWKKYRKMRWLHEYVEDGIINKTDFTQAIAEIISQPLDAQVMPLQLKEQIREKLIHRLNLFDRQLDSDYGFANKQMPDANEMAAKRLEKERGKNIALWIDGEQTDYWKEVYCLGVMDERERQLSN